MKFEDKIKLVFKNSEGEKVDLEITVKEMLERNLDDFYEDLESGESCNSSSCNNESQNFCDCGGVYEDYEFFEIIKL